MRSSGGTGDGVSGPYQIRVYLRCAVRPMKGASRMRLFFQFATVVTRVAAIGALVLIVGNSGAATRLLGCSCM